MGGSTDQRTMKTTRKVGLLLLSVVLLWLAAGIILPSLPDRPISAPKNTCVNQLRLIDVAKRQWAIENRKTNGPVAWNDIFPYLWTNAVPQCPKGGSYTLGPVGELPTCSVEGHKIP